MNDAEIRLYSAADIDELSRPSDPLARRVYDYAVPMMKEGTDKFINNAHTDLRLLVLGTLMLPVTINEFEWDNTYVCSPYTHYISYAREELVQVPSRVVRRIFRWILDYSGVFLKKRYFNRVVTVNNWLLSTNLYPHLSREHIAVITEYFKKAFPDHAIMFRSVNEMQHADMLKDFRALRYIFIASRQVYIHDARHPELLSAHARKHLHADENKLDTYGGYVVLEALSEEQSHEIVRLYTLLYLDKYSYYNPQFNARYIRHARESGMMEFMALMLEGKMVGIAGTFSFGSTVSAPMLGYDTALPQSEALYRRLSSTTFQKAQSLGAVFNNSSGASSFKLNRGFVPAIEYNALYIEHLPTAQRNGWRFMEILIGKIGAPVMKFLKL